MKVVRWNPAREFETIWNSINRFEEDAHPAARRWGVALDVTENEDGYVVEASVPGVKPDEIEITFEDNVLTVRGESAADETIKAEDYRLRERRIGRFARRLRFPIEVNIDAVTADYENGILTLNVPKAEAVKPKKIAVSVNS